MTQEVTHRAVFYRIFTIVAAIFLVWNASLATLEFFDQARRPAYGDLLMDEAFATAPASRIMRMGFAEFRCRYHAPSSCYGGAIALADGLLFKLLGRETLEQDALIDSGGTPWIFLHPYPEETRALRLFRAIAFLVLGFLMVWAFQRKRAPGDSRWIAWAAGFSTLTFVSALGARLGTKIDIPAAIVIVLLFIGSDWVLRGFAQTDQTRVPKLPLVLFGAFAGLSLGVRFSNILPLGLFAATAIALLWLRTHSVLKTIGWSVLGSVSTLASYLLLHPNTWASLNEATWFLGFFSHSKMSAPIREIFYEFVSLGFWSAWPLLLATGLLAHLGSTKGPWSSRRWLHWAYLLVTPWLLWFLVGKASWSRPHYYLPITIWGLLLFAETLPRLDEHARRRTVIAFLLLASLGAFQARRMMQLDPIRPSPLYWAEKPDSRRTAVESLLLDPAVTDETVFVIDRALQVPLRKTLWSPRTVVVFDSMSESPTSVLERLEKSGFAARSQRWIVSCWQKTPETEADSPSAFLWSTVTNTRCANADVLGGHILPFETADVPDFWTTFDETLLPSIVTIRQTPRFPNGPLSPRALEGAINGVDYWFAPLVFDTPTAIGGKFVAQKPITALRLAIESNCKTDASLVFEVEAQARTFSQTANLNVTDATCSSRPAVCRLGLLNWWSQRQPVGALEIRPPRPITAGESFTVRIEAKGAFDEDRCRVFLGKIEPL